MPRKAAHSQPQPAEPQPAIRHDDGPLTDAYRPVRAIVPPETPIGGILSRAGDDIVVLVDAGELTAWPGWGFTDAQHVLAPLDLARRAGGHDAVLPWCSERVDVFLGRRRAASAPLGGGEIVTLAVSALRGAAEAHSGRGGDAPSPTGAWWLTDAGCPVFVHAESGDAAEAGAR
ncbi:MAG TPA: hypothetical protein VNT50_04785, partial [Microbacterium sp.]|nr:hypothetical protein [Microbacterium sp.]